MSEKISESGLINQQGQLKMPMDRLNEFFPTAQREENHNAD